MAAGLGRYESVKHLVSVVGTVAQMLFSSKTLASNGPVPNSLLITHAYGALDAAFNFS